MHIEDLKIKLIISNMKSFILDNLKYLLFISAISILYGYLMGTISYNDGIFILTMVNVISIPFHLRESYLG